MSQYAYLSTPDPEYAELFNSIPYRPPSKDLAVIRNIVDNLFVGSIQEHFRPLLPQDAKYEVVDRQVAHSDGASTLLRTLRPSRFSHGQETFPCLVWIHGGGFYAGTIDFDDFRLRIACVKYKLSIAMVEYRKGPENAFPISLNDCFDGVRWVADNAGAIGADLTKGFIIGGTSAGANIAAVIAHRVRDDPFFKGRGFTGQILQIPPVCDPRSYPEKYKSELLSLNVEERYKKMTILTREMVFELYDDTLHAPVNDPEASPLLLSHEGLPPTVIQVAGLDPLRDEGILYEKVLREAGIKTKLFKYPGLPHGFHLTYPKLSGSKKFEEDTEYALQWLLGSKE